MTDHMEAKIKNRMKKLHDGTYSTPKNCKTMLRLFKFLEAKNLSLARHIIFYDKLRLACRIIGDKDFEKWDRADTEKLFAAMGKKGYSAWSLETEKGVLKTFFKWLYDTDECPKFLKWLKFVKPPNTLTKEQLLTPDDIERMILATKNTMWKALIAAFTTAARPTEIHNIRLGDIHDEGDFIKIYVGGSAGKMAKKMGQRAVYILKFADYFRPWLLNHPQREEKDAWLFLDKGSNKIFYDYMRQIIDKSAKKAGLEKNVFPYLFRHSVGTYLYGKYGSVYARRLMGHAPGSRMEAVYCHLSQTDIEDVLRGETPMANGFNFGNVGETRDLKTEFFKFINENKEAMLKLYKSWIKKRG